MKIKVKDFLTGIVTFIIMLVSFTVPLRESLYGGYSRFAMLIVLSILIAVYIYLRYSSHKISIIQTVWILAFLLTIRNNANLASGSTASTLYCFTAFFVPTLICQMDFEKRAMNWMVRFALIHAFIGLFFLLFPDLLIKNIDKLFPAIIPSQRSFLISTIKNGYLVGITGHYSTSGMYMAAGFIVSSVLLFYRAVVNQTGLIQMSKELLLTGFLGICLILTGKRAHLLFSIMVFCADYILIYNRGSYKMRIQRIAKFVIAFAIIFLVALNIPAFQSTFSRFMSQQVAEEMQIGRINSKWLPAIELFKESPVLGCGWLQFGRLHPTYNSGDEIYRNVHNIYLQLLCETGILGVILIVGTMVLTIFITLKRIMVLIKRKEYGEEFLFLVFSFSYQLFFLFYGLTGNPLYDVQTLFPYMFCCGIAYKYCSKHYLRIGKSISSIRSLM